MNVHLKTTPTIASCAPQSKASEILQNIIVGLTVSFVALSLGAALGILSGRGAFAGMISAGLLAFIVSCLGGTRVQCSGPTAPMSAVSAVVVAYALEQLNVQNLAILPQHFINTVILMCGVFLLIMALLRLGRFIALVPNVVISGFMSGIALLIWIDQVDVVFGLGGRPVLTGPVWQNFLVAMATLTLIFLLAPLAKKAVGPVAKFLPSTLLAIVVMTALCLMLQLPIEHVQLSEGFTSIAGFFQLLRAQVPDHLSLAIFLTALPFALQLALLCYLDTLLTSLVIDKISGERTKRDKELMAQGVANGLVSFVGGIPGAQATIRSVLMLKENATLRLSGIMVGVFVLIEMVLFQEWISMIPKAVFVGVLFKVGYDVFDFKPLRLYCKQVATHRAAMFKNFFSRRDDEQIFVTNREVLMIFGTTAITVWFNLNVAVAGFTVLFYLHNNLLNRKNPMRDLKPELETDAFAKQN
jgi:SulP family sulfate permease